MTKMLEQAFTEASKLPPAEQDALAARLLSELVNGGTMVPIASDDAKLSGLCFEGNVLVHRGVCLKPSPDLLAGIRDERFEQLSEGLPR